jgi:hypothetical protein
MGTHSASNIKLIRRGTSTAHITAAVSPEPVAAAAPSVPVFNSIFSYDIISQPLGKTGMINRLYDEYFPRDSLVNTLSSSLVEKINVDRMHRYPPIADRFSGELRNGEKFDAADFVIFRSNVRGIIDRCWNEPSFTNISSTVGRTLQGFFGKYRIQINERDDSVLLSIFDGKSGQLMAEFTHQAKFPLRYHIFDVPMQSKVDAKLAQLLEYALISNQTLLENILELMK